jgi:polysaccharide pyruvyl transferase WcaK-like protein
LPLCEAVARQLRENHQIISLEDPRQLKGLFRGVEMVIGMRFHSLIMAAAEDCRCFALSYDPKVSRLIAEVPMPGWELDQLPEAVNDISTTWIDFYANGEGLTSDRKHFLIDRALIHREILSRLVS